MQAVVVGLLTILPAAVYWLAFIRGLEVRGPWSALLVLATAAAPLVLLWVSEPGASAGVMVALAGLCFIISMGMLLAVMDATRNQHLVRTASFKLWLVDLLSRLLLLAGLPFLLAMIGLFLAFRTSGLGARLTRYPALGLLAGMAIMAMVLVLMPFLRRLAWGGQSLGDGPIRQMALEVAGTAQVQLLDIVVVPERTIGPRTAIADGLMMARGWIYLPAEYRHAFSAGELRAIIAHEVAHLRLGHSGRKMAVILAVVAAFMAVDVATVPFLVLTPTIVAVKGGIMGLVINLVLARVSQRLEYAADRFAVDLLGDASPLIRALQTTLHQFPGNVEPDWWRLSPPVGKRIQSVREYWAKRLEQST